MRMIIVPVALVNRHGYNRSTTHAGVKEADARLIPWLPRASSGLSTSLTPSKTHCYR